MIKVNHSVRHMLRAQGFNLKLARAFSMRGESLFWDRAGYFHPLPEQLGYRDQVARHNPQRPRKLTAGGRLRAAKRAAALARGCPAAR